jgi:predicted nuclease of predicted toxin-antitoxin system
MVRVLVDESLPRAATLALRAAGHDVTDVRDVGLRGRPDSEVQARAVEEDRIVAAADLDFANALRFPPGTHPGIIVLRVPDSWDSRARAERLVSGIGEAGADTLRGAIVIVEPDRMRIFAPPTEQPRP